VTHHRAALLTIAAALLLAAAGGLAFASVEHISCGLGLYWAVATATTVGYGDVAPRTGAGHVIAVLVMLSAIPLWSASFSFFASGLVSLHVRSSERRMKAHLEDRLRHHLGGGGNGPSAPAA
jgi:voltage-gated potassium channel